MEQRQPKPRAERRRYRFDDLHISFHALRDSYVCDGRSKALGYDLAVTPQEGMTAIFWRLWNSRTSTAARSHLDLLSVELKELPRDAADVQ